MKVKLFLKKHSPEIFAVCTIAGLVGTVAAAIKATPKAQKAVEELKASTDKPPTKLQVFKTAAPYYIPTGLTGLATVTCVVGSVTNSKKTITSLSGSYVLVADQYRRYRTSLKELYGEETHRTVVENMETVPRKDADIAAVGGLVCHGFQLPENSKRYLFFDSISEIFFEATYEEVLSAIYHLNRNFAAQGYLALNDYYAFLGIECDSLLGWSVTDFEIPSLDISIWKGTKDGKECYILEPLFEPDAAYMNDWK